MLKVTKPKFKKTTRYLDRIGRFDPKPILHEFGQRGVNALSNATPVDTGETSRGWSYKIKEGNGVYKLVWTNNVVAGQAPLVLLLQYGHATKSGYYLSGRDFINPALRPIYKDLNKRLREEVSP